MSPTSARITVRVENLHTVVEAIGDIGGCTLASLISASGALAPRSPKDSP